MTQFTKGNGIKVAVLDSGVGLDHEDISTKVVARANFSGAASPDDIYGHGMHMTGTVAATGDNGLGVAGVCPGCTILAGKVLNDSGEGSSSSLANGINWAVSNGAKVINISLGVRASRTSKLPSTTPGAREWCLWLRQATAATKPKSISARTRTSSQRVPPQE